jgi:hypothetical protein
MPVWVGKVGHDANLVHLDLCAHGRPDRLPNAKPGIRVDGKRCRARATELNRVRGWFAYGARSLPVTSPSYVQNLMGAVAGSEFGLGFLLQICPVRCGHDRELKRKCEKNRPAFRNTSKYLMSVRACGASYSIGLLSNQNVNHGMPRPSGLCHPPADARTRSGAQP